MLAIGYVVLFIGTLFLGLEFAHFERHGVVNLAQSMIALFMIINLMICLWEMVLFFYIGKIRDDFVGKTKRLEPGQLGKIFLFEEVSLREALKPSYWSSVWSTYALVDASYSDKTSFGWTIDIGNGFSSIVPTILFALGMTFQQDLMPARVLGIIGAMSCWQMAYGTILYATQYVVNKRWEPRKSTWGQIFMLVILSNGLWLIGPFYAMYYCFHLVLSDDANPYEVFNQHTVPLFPVK